MPRRRLAVALLVPSPVAAEIEGLRHACGDANRLKVAPHATLVPPINVPEGNVGDALAVVRDVAASFSPLRLEVGPATTFGPAGTVLYLAVGGPDLDRLRELQAALVTGPFERPPQHSEFVPHVTISIALPAERVEAAIAALADFRAEVTIDRVTTLENVRDDEAERHVWTPIADALLGGRSVVGRGGLELELTVSGSVEPDVRAWVDPQWERADLEALGVAAEENPLIITARCEARPVGLLQGWTWGDLAFVVELLVDEAHRDQGFARHLLARFEAEARERGCTSMALRTQVGSRAQAIYEHLGWEQECVHRGWVAGQDLAQYRRRLI